MIVAKVIAVQMSGGQAAAIVAQDGLAVDIVAQPANIAIQGGSNWCFLFVVLLVEYAELCFSHTVGVLR